MSLSPELTLPLGAEEYVFRLRLGEERKIEEKCGAGLPELARRLAPVMNLARVTRDSTEADRGAIFLRAISQGAIGDFRVDDYREPLYQGLVGGGMDATLAGVLIREHVDGQPRLTFAVMAFQLIMETLAGGREAEPGEKRPAGRKKRSRRSPTASPDGGTSTPAAP